MDIDSNGLKIQQRQFRGPCTNLAIEDIDGCAIRLVNAIFSSVSASQFSFSSKFGTKRARINQEGVLRIDQRPNAKITAAVYR